MSPLIKIVSVVVVLALAAGGYFFSTQQGGADENSMTIQFRSNSWDTLNSVEISPAGANAYVSLPLTDGTLAPAEVFAYTIADGREVCTYDLRVTKEDGAKGSYDNVNLCDQTFYHFEETGFE